MIQRFFPLMCVVGIYASTITICERDFGASVKKELGACSKIAGATLGSGVAFSVLLHQINAYVCSDSFTVWPRPKLLKDLDYGQLGDLFAEGSASWRALFWGVYEGGIISAAIAVPLVLAARVGSLPQLEMHELVKPLAIALSGVGLAGSAYGYYGYSQAKAGNLPKNRMATKGVNINSFDAHWGVTYAEDGAFYAGAAACVGLVAWTLYQRYMKKLEKDSKSCQLVD